MADDPRGKAVDRECMDCSREAETSRTRVIFASRHRVRASTIVAKALHVGWSETSVRVPENLSDHTTDVRREQSEGAVPDPDRVVKMLVVCVDFLPERFGR